MVKLFFNLAMTSNAIGVTYFTYHLAVGYLNNSLPLLLVVAACAYFLSNTVPVAIVIALSEERSLHRIWTETFLLVFSVLPGWRSGGRIDSPGESLRGLAECFASAAGDVLAVPFLSSVPRPSGRGEETRRY